MPPKSHSRLPSFRYTQLGTLLALFGFTRFRLALQSRIVDYLRFDTLNLVLSLLCSVSLVKNNTRVFSTSLPNELLNILLRDIGFLKRNLVPMTGLEPVREFLPNGF